MINTRHLDAINTDGHPNRGGVWGPNLRTSRSHIPPKFRLGASLDSAHKESLIL